jgi:NTE family protein
VVPLDLTFQDAYELTGRFINISISPAEKHQESRLLNAITSPNVYVRSAVSASSSVPGVLPSERLYARGIDKKPRPYLPSRRWVDGSVSGDLPAKRLSRLYGVNHFIVSMINPAVAPFISDSTLRNQQGVGLTVRDAGMQVAREIMVAVEHKIQGRGRVPNFVAAQLSYVTSLIGQEYLGDINIILGLKDFKWRHVLFEFREGEIESLIEAGRRNTWPKLAMIKNAARVSETLDRIQEQLDHEGDAPNANTRHRLVV